MGRAIAIVVGVLLLLFVLFGPVGCERIDAGYEGIKVELYGSDRGVQDVELVTGWVWYNPWTTKVYEYPTFVQHKVWTADENEDSPRNEELIVTTKDGLTLSFDVTLNYRIEAQRASDIFKKYRKPLDQITDEFIRTSIRNAYNGQASKMKAEEILTQRAEYEDTVERVVTESLAKEGFVISQMAIAGKVRTPKSLENAINAKIEAVQNAQRAENEKQQVIAEAQKRIEEARGYAEAEKMRADADAYAYQKRAQTLTPLIVQQQFLNRWDGKLPVYGAIPQLFRDVSK